MILLKKISEISESIETLKGNLIISDSIITINPASWHVLPLFYQKKISKKRTFLPSSITMTRESLDSNLAMVWVMSSYINRHEGPRK